MSIPVQSTVTFSDYLNNRSSVEELQNSDNFVLNTENGLQKVSKDDLYNDIKNQIVDPVIPQPLESIVDSTAVNKKGTRQGNIINNIATGEYSFASGNQTQASGNYSHTEGNGTIASNRAGHAEGEGTVVSGIAGHAEGEETKASGKGSHAEGHQTQAQGNYSHAGGDNTIATGDSQTVIGKYNYTDNQYAFIIGNGQSSASRSNAFTVDWNGDVRVGQHLYTTGFINTGSLSINGNEIARVGGTNTHDGLVNAISTTYEKPRFFAIGTGANSAGWHDGIADTSLIATDSQPGLMSAAYHQRLHRLKAEFLSIAGKETAIIKSTGSTYRLMSVSHLSGDNVKIGLYYFCSTSLTLYPIVYIGGNEDVIQQNNLIVTSDGNGNYSFTNNYGAGTTPIKIIFLGSRANSQLYSDFTSSINGSEWEGPTSADI